MTNKSEINVFLHTIEDVNSFYKNIYVQNNRYVIYATHAGVFEYIKEFYCSEVILFSTLINPKEISKINIDTENLSLEILNILDSRYSDEISKKIKIERINYFISLYSYHFPFVLMGLFTFKELMLKVKSANKNIVFDYTDSFYGVFSMKEFLEYTFSSNDVKIAWYKSEIKQSKNGITDLIIKAVKNSKKAFSIAVDYLYEYLAYNYKNKKTILYMDNLYDVSFLKRLGEFRLIAYAHQALSHKFSKPLVVSVTIDSVFEKRKEEAGSLKEFLSKVLIKDFTKKIEQYTIGLKTLDELLSRENIDLTIWGSPPVQGFKALFYDYCMAKKISAIGVQHGANYIDKKYQKHYYSDFIRCNHYISYGFTKEDLKNNFKDKAIHNLEVYSYGTNKSIKPKESSKYNVVDVLFPVTNTISIFDGGFTRVKPDVLHADQMSILNLLEEESKSNITSLIKPFSNTDIWQTSVFLNLQKLQFAKVQWKKALAVLLNEITPKCVIIEFMSTPLYEVLDLDVEIFLFIRDIDNLTDKARGMLNKRVYMVEDFNEFSILFKKWINKDLAKKRDNSYYNYYVKKENTKESIIKLIKEI